MIQRIVIWLLALILGVIIGVGVIKYVDNNDGQALSEFSAENILAKNSITVTDSKLKETVDSIVKGFVLTIGGIFELPEESREEALILLARANIIALEHIRELNKITLIAPDLGGMTHSDDI